MNHPKEIGRHLLEFYYGPNQSGINLKDTLKDVDLILATKIIGDHNSILALVFHIDYYVAGITSVLEGGELTIRDQFSFDHPRLSTEEEWQAFITQVFANGQRFSERIGALAENEISSSFVKPAYGTYYRNLVGCTEHLYYHLGQIALLKKMYN